MRSGLMYPALIRPAVATLVRAARRIGPVRSCGKPVHSRNIPEALGRGGVMRYAAVLILAGIVAASALFFTTAQAQSVITLVSNTDQSTSATNMTVGKSGSNQYTQAQTFTTGDNVGGYTLSGVQVDIVVGQNSVDDTARVSIYTADSDGKPDALKYTLTNPPVVPDGLNTFTAPVGATLDAETEYAVVVEQAGSEPFFIRGTDGNDQSSDEVSAGWAIQDNRWSRSRDARAWGSHALNPRIAVKGAAGATVIVPVDWDLIPSGLDEGDSFRLLFLSSTKRDATTTDIADYNTFIQTRAAAGHTAIQAYANEFLVVGSTQDTDARDNTDTTYTAVDKGAPIYWLNGNKVADNYEDFYDGSWSNESNANDKDESGANGPNTAHSGNYPFTGSDHDGTEAIIGNNSSRALGSSGQVRVGRPGGSDANNGPLGSSATTDRGDRRPFYGLSPVFTISDPPTLTSVIVPSHGFTIDIFFDEGLDATSGSLPATVIAAFSVYADTVELTISDIYPVLFLNPPNQLYIALGPTGITQGQTVTLDYDQSAAGTDALADADGHKVLTFTDFAVTNNSTATAPPGPPTGLSATAVGQTRIDLSWTAPSAIGGADISGYKIEVSSDSGSSWSDLVADTGSTGTTYSHTGLSAASTRHYRVSAINSVGAGTASGPASATTTAAPGVSVNPTMLSVNEGLTGTYTVVLNTQPGAGVTVTPRSSDANKVTFAPASLSFTTTDWNTAQTVTVTGVEDDDGKNDTATITHTVSGYAGVFTAPSIPVTVPDNDTRGVTVTPTRFLVDADESITYTVVLDTQPVGGSVTVTANVTDPANPEISVSPSRLVFTASNWSRGQTVTVTSYPNADAAARVVHTISHAVSGADYGSETAAAVIVTVTDSAVDVAAAIDLTPVAGSDAYYSSPGFALGILETVTDVNWVRVRMFETRQYRLELVMKPSLAPNLGLSWDAVIEGVYSAAGQQLAGPESQGPAGVSWEPTGSTDWFRLRQPTEYYYVAVASGGRSVGGWDLQVYHHPAGMPQESPEASADLSSPARVEVGGCFEGGMVNKRNTIDEDWIGMQLTQGVEYLIEVRAWDSGLGSLIDADLGRARFDPSDTAIADLYGDDGSVWWSSRLDQGERQEERITWTPRVSGLYFLPILNPGAFTGSYVLSVSESVDGSVDCGPTTALAVAAAVAVPVIDPVDPPARPRGLTGTVVHNAVSLNWDDPGDASITGYQILRLDRDVHGLGNFQVHVDDTGSAAASYVDTDVASETRYVYRLKARNAAGLSERSDFFRADTPSEPEPNSPATGAPAIGGTAQVGETLTADTSGIADADGLERAVFAYQWSIILGAASADITGATEAAYTPVDADEGLAIRVRVSFTDDGGNAETLTSAATAAVAAKPNSPATGAPVITGTAQVGETLSADTSGIADEDGLANVSYSYQWLADDADIAGATGSTYTPVDADEGVAIKIRVAFTDDRGNDEGSTSAVPAAVAGLPPEPLTAGFENTPSSHDGENVFTFELRFSEEIRLSYRTLRDRAFTVVGGAVNKARRMEQGSSIHWRITVKPNSGSDVSIVLPVTSDCEDQGAICAEDGRMLSSRLELTVSGPGG